MNARKLLCSLALIFLCASAARAADNVLITEFMAANDGVLRDEDGDAEDWIELHNAGTNPTNVLSYLRVDVQSMGLGATVSFGAISNRTYTILYSDGPENPQWLKLGDFAARTNNRVEMLNDPAFTTGRYYRVATPQQP